MNIAKLPSEMAGIKLKKIDLKKVTDDPNKLADICFSFLDGQVVNANVVQKPAGNYLRYDVTAKFPTSKGFDEGDIFTYLKSPDNKLIEIRNVGNGASKIFEGLPLDDIKELGKRILKLFDK